MPRCGTFSAGNFLMGTSPRHSRGWISTATAGKLENLTFDLPKTTQYIARGVTNIRAHNVAHPVQDADRWSPPDRLSGDDLRDGLAAMGLHLDQGEIDALIRRGDFDGDSHIDYLEFLVRFGLQQKAEGKWEYKAVDNSAGVQDAEAAKPMRKGVLPSRWHGRGGVAATLLRFDADKDGKLKKDEFEKALRDGLGASELTSDDVDAIVPARFPRPSTRNSFSISGFSAIDFLLLQNLTILTRKLPGLTRCPKP
jgi:hypothetical protein